MLPNNTDSPIKIDKSGIVLGGLDSVATILNIVCSNSSVQNETAVVFGMNLEAQGNFSMKDLIFYPKIDAIRVINANFKKSHIEIKNQNFDAVFNQILNDEADRFNAKWAKGWSVASIDPSLAMLTGLLKNTTLTPYVMDHWMYGGFGMQADLPTLPNPELTFI